MDPEEKKRIKELARRMKEDQAKKDKDRETLSKIGIGGVTTLGKIPKIPKKTPSSSDLKDKEKVRKGILLSDLLQYFFSFFNITIHNISGKAEVRERELRRHARRPG